MTPGSSAAVANDGGSRDGGGRDGGNSNSNSNNGGNDGSSSSNDAPGSIRFDGIGTGWQIDTAEPLPADVLSRILDRVERFDRTWSRFRDDSLVARIAREPGTWRFPEEAGELFEVYRRLFEATDGAVTPLGGRALDNLGYDATYSLRQHGTPAAVPRWDESFAWDGVELTTLRPVLLDVGAAGKGYLADLVARILADAGIRDYVIDASGDIVHAGSEPIRVALEHPREPSKAIGVVTLQNASLCASATNRRAWGAGLHHIIDPFTGLPSRGVIATWAIAATGVLADGLATALFFRDPARLDPAF